MMKRITVLVIAILIVLSALTSCSVKTPESKQSSEITTVAEPSTAAPTEKPTEKPTEATTEEPTEPTTTPSIDVMMSPDGSSYLLQAETAWISGFYPYGVLKQEDIKETTLPAGTIMIAHSLYRPDSLDPYPGNDVFVLEDGRYVFFDQSTSANGEVLYNGRTLSEFFGGFVWGDFTRASWYDLYDGEKKIVENYELLPNTPLDPSIQPQNMVINVDWNGDGKTDSIVRECPDPNQTWDCTVWYTDGATGERTNVTGRFFKRIGEDIAWFTDYVMLFKDENTGRYALIDTVDKESWDFSIFVYSFDSNDIITHTETWGSFVFENGKMYTEYGGYLFGNVPQTIAPLVFDGTSVTIDESQEVWWVAALEAKENGEALPSSFTYTLTDVSVEKKSGDVYEDQVVPGGVAVFPQYYVWNENKGGESGYVYFLLADGSECRAVFGREEVNENYLYWSVSGTDQEELFYCIRGG